MFSFVLSVLSVLGAFAFAVMLLIMNDAEKDRDPTEGMGTWDHLTGKGFRAISNHQDQIDFRRNWAVGLFAWAGASAIFAVARGVQLFGG